MKNVKTLLDLDLIESTIEDYQDIFKIDLIKYHRQVQQMRENFPKRVFYLEVQRDK